MDASAAQPWTDVDAVAYVQGKIDWYERHRRTARLGAIVHDVLLLGIGGATTLAAALHAPAWLTATLAAISFVLAGLMQVFRWRDNWASRAIAWTSLTAALNRFRLLAPEERDRAATARLIAATDRIVAVETRNWANVSHGQRADRPDAGRPGADRPDADPPNAGRPGAGPPDAGDDATAG